MVQDEHAALAAKYPNLSDSEREHLWKCKECLFHVIDRITRSPAQPLELDATAKKILKQSRQRFEARHNLNSGIKRGSSRSNRAMTNKRNSSQSSQATAKTKS